ncbi:hypothetical protein RZS08_13910, partial [Arthrospira platensis SPKY1]|nr:hypothetical protein [Arthrospira platensis SPKY1]
SVLLRYDDTSVGIVVPVHKAMRWVVLLDLFALPGSRVVNRIGLHAEALPVAARIDRTPPVSRKRLIPRLDRLDRNV